MPARSESQTIHRVVNFKTIILLDLLNISWYRDLVNILLGARAAERESVIISKKFRRSSRIIVLLNTVLLNTTINYFSPAKYQLNFSNFVASEPVVDLLKYKRLLL